MPAGVVSEGLYGNDNTWYPGFLTKAGCRVRSFGMMLRQPLNSDVPGDCVAGNRDVATIR